MKKTLLFFSAILSLSVQAEDATLDCRNPHDTLEINQCASFELEAAQSELTTYLQASLDHLADDPELIESIEAAQKDWEAYRSSHCDSVYMQWRGGTIRGLMGLACKTHLTRQRTHEIWSNFLTYMDSTPSLLPEPEE